MWQTTLIFDMTVLRSDDYSTEVNQFEIIRNALIANDGLGQLAPDLEFPGAEQDKSTDLQVPAYLALLKTPQDHTELTVKRIWNQEQSAKDWVDEAKTHAWVKNAFYEEYLPPENVSSED